MTKSTRLKVALLGCGQIADAHLQEIGKIECAELVAVCDRHGDLARQAAARFGVPRAFEDLGEMLEAARPDVLHVTTPPHLHRPHAIQALEAGAHVYVEKPFAPDATEAGEILDAARANRRIVCVGHDQLFDPLWQSVRDMAASGELGRIVHVDSIQGYDLSGPFGRVLMADADHWVHRLPGGLFQNIISHALYKITDLLPDESPRVFATAFAGLAHDNLPTELRVLLQGAETTGSLVFTSAARPIQRRVQIYGTRRSIEIDFDGFLLRSFPRVQMRGAFGRIEMPFRHLTEATRSLLRNVGRFLGGRHQYFAGMNCLFREFYRSVLEDGPPPVPYEEILRVTALMDTIFENCRTGRDEFAGWHAPGTADSDSPQLLAHS